MRRRKAYCTSKEGYASTQANWKRKSEFYKKEELSENSTYSFEQIRSTDKKKIVLVLVRVKFSWMPLFSFQIKPWGYKEIKNSDGKVNISAFRDVRKWYLGARDYSPCVNNNRNKSYNVIFSLRVAASSPLLCRRTLPPPLSEGGCGYT